MTAPDDLARTRDTIVPIAERWIDYGGRSGKTAHQIALGIADDLASVVSRRDTDLRTRIEKVLGHCVHNGPCEVMPNGNCDALTDGTLLRSLLARALDADTREDAP